MTAGGRERTLVKLQIGHESEMFDKPNEEGHTHRWTCFVRPIASLKFTDRMFINKVKFNLHESYKDSTRIVRDPPFEVTETGFGSFPIQLEIYFNYPGAKAFKYRYDMLLQMTKKGHASEEATFAVKDAPPSFTEMAKKYGTKRKRSSGAEEATSSSSCQQQLFPPLKMTKVDVAKSPREVIIKPLDDRREEDRFTRELRLQEKERRERDKERERKREKDREKHRAERERREKEKKRQEEKEKEKEREKERIKEKEKDKRKPEKPKSPIVEKIKKESPSAMMKKDSPSNFLKKESPSAMVKTNSPSNFLKESPSNLMNKKSPSNFTRKDSPSNFMKKESPSNFIKKESPSIKKESPPNSSPSMRPSAHPYSLPPQKPMIIKHAPSKTTSEERKPFSESDLSSPSTSYGSITPRTPLSLQGGGHHLSLTEIQRRIAALTDEEQVFRVASLLLSLPGTNLLPSKPSLAFDVDLSTVEPSLLSRLCDALS